MSKYPLGLLVCLTLLPLIACENTGKRGGVSSFRDSELVPGVAKAPSRRAPELLKINGVFVPTRLVKIRSEFNGQLENLTIATGQVVSAQNLLFRIADEQLPEEIDFLRIQLQQAEARLEQIRADAEVTEPEEEVQAEVVIEAYVQTPAYERDSYREPTFSQLASEIPFTSVDAGGIWPGIDPRVIARSNDPQDAGGIWPSYGAREMVNGEGSLSSWTTFFSAASVPVPASSAEFTRVQNLILTQAPSLEEPESEEETPATPEPSQEESRLSLYQARVDLMRAELAVLENELLSRDISSPLDGRVHELLVSEGSKIQVGDFLVEIYQVNPIEFSFQIPKDQVDFLELGMKLKGRVLDPSGLAYEGEISYIGAELDIGKKTMEVRARIDNADDALKVGMKGAAEILLGPASVAISEVGP